MMKVNTCEENVRQYCENYDVLKYSSKDDCFKRKFKSDCGSSRAKDIAVYVSILGIGLGIYFLVK